IGLDALDHMANARRIGEIAVIEVHTSVLLMRIRIDCVETLGIKTRCAANNPVNFVPFVEQELREKRAILARDSGNESFLHGGAAGNNVFTHSTARHAIIGYVLPPRSTEGTDVSGAD